MPIRERIRWSLVNFSSSTSSSAFFASAVALTATAIKPCSANCRLTASAALLSTKAINSTWTCICCSADSRLSASLTIASMLRKPSSTWACLLLSRSSESVSGINSPKGSSFLVLFINPEANSSVPLALVSPIDTSNWKPLFIASSLALSNLSISLEYLPSILSKASSKGVAIPSANPLNRSGTSDQEPLNLSAASSAFVPVSNSNLPTAPTIGIMMPSAADKPTAAPIVNPRGPAIIGRMPANCAPCWLKATKALVPPWTWTAKSPNW